VLYSEAESFNVVLMLCNGSDSACSAVSVYKQQAWRWSPEWHYSAIIDRAHWYTPLTLAAAEAAVTALVRRSRIQRRQLTLKP